MSNMKISITPVSDTDASYYNPVKPVEFGFEDKNITIIFRTDNGEERKIEFGKKDIQTLLKLMEMYDKND